MNNVLFDVKHKKVEVQMRLKWSVLLFTKSTFSCALLLGQTANATATAPTKWAASMFTMVYNLPSHILIVHLQDIKIACVILACIDCNNCRCYFFFSVFVLVN